MRNKDIVWRQRVLNASDLHLQESGDSLIECRGSLQGERRGKTAKRRGSQRNQGTLLQA